MSKPTKPRLDPDQHRRFLEAARELGCDENVARLGEVVRRAAKLSPERRPAAR